MKDGHPYREHLEAATKIGGPAGAAARAELTGPEFPEALAYAWRWFCELIEARTYGETGPLPIAHAEIASWKALTRRAPTAWEIQLLRALDRAWLEPPRGS